MIKDLKPPTPNAIPLKIESPGKYDDLPEIHSVGMAKVKGGWVALDIVTQGLKVVSTEIIAGPELKPIIMEQVKLAVVKRLFLEKTK
jgi:hypothetical protein